MDKAGDNHAPDRHPGTGERSWWTLKTRQLRLEITDASYCEALARLAGLLADIPFLLEWHVPTEKVVTDWRLPVPPALLEDLFWHAAGPLIGDDEPSAVLLAGMTVLAADGMLVNLADTPANRAFFGSTGTADGSSPFPQLRVVAVTARAGRAMPGAILGQAGTGEQTLLKRLVKRRPGLFAGRVICFDRNFPGYDLITAILQAGGHVIARVKEGISLGFEDGPGRGWLPDGSRMTWLNAPSGKKADRLPVRAAEHNVTMPGAGGDEQASETCTVITTVLDHEAAPAGAGPGCLSHPVERIGDHVRRGQIHDRRGREAHLRPRPAVRLPAAGHPGSLGLADRHPASARQRGRRAPHRGRRRPRPAPQVPDPGHRRRGILHRRPAPRDPVDDIHAGHGFLIAGSDRRSGRLRRPRMPAHPQSPRPATALRTGAESTAEIPARQRHQDHRHRETQGHRVRTRLLLTPAQGPATRRSNPPRPAGTRGPWNRALPPPRHAG